MNRRNEILDQVRAIPALPPAAAEVLALAQKADTGVAEVMAGVETDPALTAELLRIANSAYFAGPRQIESLRDAGVTLGLRRVVELVLVSAIFPFVDKPIAGYDLPQGALVDHAMAVALGTEEIARAVKLTPPPHAFTAGLLADIGKIVLGTFLEVDAEPILDLALAEQIPFEQAERRILQIDHAEAGAELLRAWNLPANIVEVVRWHHEPERITTAPLAVDLVHFADLLVLQTGIGLGIDGLNYTASPVALKRLNVAPAMYELAACQVFLHLQGVQRAMN